MPSGKRSLPRGSSRRQGKHLPSAADAEAAVRTLLAWMGDDPARAGLRATPSRVAASLLQIAGGRSGTLDSILEGATFEEEASGVVLMRDVEFYSVCEHHLLPFFGRCHVAYLPGRRMIGFSRIPRLVDHYARRLQVQERMTRQIALALEKTTRPKGVACVVEAFHLCMAMRGVGKQRAVAVTSALRGVFANSPGRWPEVAALLRGNPGSVLER
jgi:GTP cyclohydrolase I